MLDFACMLDPALLAPETTRLLRRAEYDELVALGAFADERVELLRGQIVKLSPNNPPHASPVSILTRLLILALAGRADVRVQLPILAAGESEPEPDVAVVPLGDYSKTHPDKALLIIEVAQRSLRKDRLVKGPLYAASGFEEYWLFNVDERSVEVHRGPVGEGWTSITRHELGETLAPVGFPDVTVRIADVLV
jgi:Uma2 family endonuclease